MAGSHRQGSNNCGPPAGAFACLDQQATDGRGTLEGVHTALKKSAAEALHKRNTNLWRNRGAKSAGMGDERLRRRRRLRPMRRS